MQKHDRRSAVKYLFRQEVPHHFITTEDPSYRYEWLCGHCGYPVEQADPRCPRCQQLLEHCSVCSDRTHKRPVALPRDQVTGAVHCGVCGVERIGFGRMPLADLRGSFCTNLYGCPAGGLLLASEEFAVLPEDASLCPVCRNEELLPLDVRTFRYHLQRCVFCSTVFEREPSWKPGWSEDTRRLYTVGSGTADEIPCPVCGRNDHLDEDSSGEKVWIQVKDSEHDSKEPLDCASYLRLAELGRILALYPNAKRASDELFALWYQAGERIPAKVRSVTVSLLFDMLQRGTVVEASKRWIQPRRQAIGKYWERKFPGQWEDYLVEVGVSRMSRE